MTFVYEEMSEDDYKKYDIAFLGSRFGGGHNRNWVRDEEADAYFKFANREIGGESRNATYLFYWEGELYEVVLFESYEDDEKGRRVESHLKSCTHVKKEGEKLHFFRDFKPSAPMLDCLKLASRAYKAARAAQINKTPTALVFNF